ncbi:MAG TPA: endopeptidase La [Thermoanaerobaculia bacterium]|nr:endopeptidase La [Thermoanaerobaculia bacterium]
MNERQTLPVLALRNFVLFPGVTAPIQAGRPRTLKAIEAALASGESPRVFAVSQREPKEEASAEDLHTIGTIARILQIQRGLNGMQLLIQGEERGIAVRIAEEDGYFQAVVREAEELRPLNPEEAAFQALYREAREKAAELGEKSGLPGEVVQQLLATVDDPGRLADLVAGYSDIPHPQKQMLLETLAVEERLRRVLVHVQRQISVIEAQEDIKSQVQEELGGRQREMFLREQLKAIQKELGEDAGPEQLEELRELLAAKDLPEAVRIEIERELGRLGRMNREAMEAQVIRTYLETIAELPWRERSEDHLDLKRAEEVLEEDHYGLEDVKDRVLEFLAVRQLRDARERALRSEEEEEESPVPAASAGPAGGAPVAAPPAGPIEAATVLAAQAPVALEESPADGPAESPADGEPPGDERPQTPPGNLDEKASKGPILLFVGPPGVGKTSVARSIARAMGRKYVRVSLGGVRDEADIRGHRRTYVGSMPGRIIQGMRQAGTKNPVFLLDEVDKLGVSYQGDPASALLEVLDPAQNDSFTDHYLGVPYDLSEVLFITTANFIQSIPGPLLDRMEVVEFSGYTEREKLEIANRYLVPRQVQENGLTEDQIELSEDAVAEVITRYTREAGVRQLERSIGKLARKVARRIAAGETERVTVTAGNVGELLGRPRVHPEKALTEDKVGLATGMYYTPTGGDIMFVEASPMRGKGELLLTGQLGDVMKESARAALTYAKAHASSLGIPDEAFDNDVHVHVPAGAIPKDGPSAGVTMATAVVSALSGRPVRHDVAMTGEITLSGRVLPIGGVKEKILGAVRAGIRRVVLPRENESHLEDLPEEVRSSIEVYLTDELGEVLALTLRGATFREGRLYFSDEAADGRPSELHH